MDPNSNLLSGRIAEQFHAVLSDELQAATTKKTPKKVPNTVTGKNCECTVPELTKAPKCKPPKKKAYSTSEAVIQGWSLPPQQHL